MALTRPFPVDKAFPNAVDIRRELAGLLPREGVLPTPGIVSLGVAYKGSTWSVGARAFVAVARRAGAAFSLSGYGSALIANDANATAWTLPGAPSSGSRIDLLWVKVADPTQGDALTTPGGETIARAVPVFGITAGVAGTNPARPALPAGALELGEATTPAGAASVAGTTLRNSFAYASVLGGAILVLAVADLPADAIPGETAVILGTGARYVRGLTAWRPAVQWVAEARGADATNFEEPPVGTEPTFYTGYMKTFTDASGLVTVDFENPFPTRCMHVSLTTIEGTTVAGVINSRAISRLAFTARFVGVATSTVAFTFLAIGY